MSASHVYLKDGVLIQGWAISWFDGNRIDGITQFPMDAHLCICLSNCSFLGEIFIEGKLDLL